MLFPSLNFLHFTLASADPGAFNQFNGIPGALGRFLSFWSVFVSAAFSYAGTEVVGLLAAEAENPAVAIPRATRTVFVGR